MEPRPMDDHEQTEPEALATSPEVEPLEAVAGPRCPWCSVVHSADAKKCPSCGATLISEEEALDREIVGLTTVDPGLVEHDQWLRNRRDKKRRSILGTLLGHDDEELRTSPSPAPAYASATEGAVFLPPSDDVKREMARLEAEAAYARALAEAEARAIEQKIDEMDAAASRAAGKASAGEEARGAAELEAAEEVGAPESAPAAGPPAPPSERPEAAG